MERLFDLQFYLEQLAAAQAWLAANALALSLSTLAQVAVIGLAFVPARLTASRVRSALHHATKSRYFEETLRPIALALAPLALPLVWLVVQWLSVLIAARLRLPHHLIETAVSLLTAWVVIRLTTALVRDPVWSRFIALVAWTIAALNILGILAPTMQLLDSAAITVGELRVSALTVVKAMLALAVLLWLATLAGRTLERRITASPRLTPSLQVLIVKLLKIALVALAVVAALRAVGIDLTAFAVFTGAVGVGVGFGLQKAVANFVSGIGILLDKSIKPGDVIAVGDTYGRVQSLGTRYVSVTTRDGVEYLIPNEQVVGQQVVNWSYSGNEVRLKIPLGVSYDADVRQAMALSLEAAGDTGRVLKDPEPVCLLKGFGESAVELELRIWISDPMNGAANVKSDVLLRVWDKFRAAGIQIPFPQRDLRLKEPLKVDVVGRASEAPRPGEGEPKLEPARE